MERLRSVSISIEIDTNKATYRETFDSLDDLIDWWNANADIGLPPAPPRDHR